MARGQAESLLSSDERSKDVLSPLFSVNDLLYSKTLLPSQWIINFKDMPEEEARQHRACFRWVEEHVKTERQSCSRKDAQKFWWRLVGRASSFFEVVERLELRKVLVNARISKHLVFAFADASFGFEANVNMFAYDEYWVFSVLQSAIHLTWADYRASSLRTDRRYTPTTCFDSFPFPVLSEPLQYGLELKARLNVIGTSLDRHRTTMLAHEASGLTELYNQHHDQECQSEAIRSLREFHTQVDNAVAAAYGWSDLDLGHGFHETKQGTRFTISEVARREVLARLLKLNHERYAEEVAQGLHDKAKGKPKAAGRKGKKSSSKDEPMLF